MLPCRASLANETSIEWRRALPLPVTAKDDGRDPFDIVAADAEAASRRCCLMNWSRAMTEVVEAKGREVVADAPSPLAAILADPERLKELEVEKIERLWQLQKDSEDRVAKLAFMTAFNRVQSQMGPVRKRHLNNQTGSTYAKAEEIEAMLDPILAREGFSRSLSQGGEIEDGMPSQADPAQQRPRRRALHGRANR